WSGPRSTQWTKSVADNTPTQRPLPLTTGAPVTAAWARRWAAPRSDISSETVTRGAVMRSAAVREKRGLVTAVMTHFHRVLGPQEQGCWGRRRGKQTPCPRARGAARPPTAWKNTEKIAGAGRHGVAAARGRWAVWGREWAVLTRRLILLR